jgi:hypothetical protein
MEAGVFSLQYAEYMLDFRVGLIDVNLLERKP